MPEQFENGGNLTVKTRCRTLMSKKYLHPKNQSVSFHKRRKMFCFFSSFSSVHRMSFQNVPVGAPFSKSSVFEICRQKMCRFRVNGRPIRHIFHRFQNVLASCERSLKVFEKIENFLKDPKISCIRSGS